MFWYSLNTVAITSYIRILKRFYQLAHVIFLWRQKTREAQEAHLPQKAIKMQKQQILDKNKFKNNSQLNIRVISNSVGLNSGGNFIISRAKSVIF